MGEGILVCEAEWDDLEREGYSGSLILLEKRYRIHSQGRR